MSINGKDEAQSEGISLSDLEDFHEDSSQQEPSLISYKSDSKEDAVSELPDYV